LREIATQAGYIFSGTVVSVQRTASRQPNAVETVNITFRVEEGVRGARSGQLVTIREWAALWNNGERYQVGEHVVLLLHPLSKVGLTSPVGGALGKFNLDSTGAIILPLQQNQLLSADPAAGPWLRRKGGVKGHDFARILRRMAKE
jgi:hypothetical protein